MKQHQAFPGKFLKAADFEDGPRILTIKKVTHDKVSDDESKLVVHWKEDDAAAMVLNKTNFNMIEEITGEDDTDNWGGAVLKVGRVKVDFQGQRVWGVRVLDAGVPSAVASGRKAPTSRPDDPGPSDDDLDHGDQGF